MQNEFHILLATMSLDIGGAETHIVELAKGLKKEGFHVVVASNGGGFVKELENCNIKHYTVPLHNKKPNNVYKAYKMLQQIVIEEKIDLVHAHARIPGFICNTLHKKMKFAFVTTAHGTWKTGGGLKYITRWGQKTIAVSEDVKKYLLDNYTIDESNIKVTINGIDTEKFSSNVDYSKLIKEFNILEDSFKVVYVSRIDRDREIILESILQLLPQLIEKTKSLQFFIVGGGNILHSIKEAAEKINRTAGRDALVVTGSRMDINRFNAMADLFIGFGRSSLEAMASSQPVIIAGNQGYIGLLNENNIDLAIKTNFSGRGQGMASTERFLTDILEVANMTKEQREHLGSFCRSIVLQQYSISKMVADNIEIYMQLLKNS
ncbi:MAG: epsD 1 [Clostridia bacterium]|jgi:glycosyltransferase involved in cell wall biosynthesis|nr:epsD 1 [Clostridia bacterium]